MGPEMGELLSRAWNKPVVGVNAGQELLVASPSEALAMAPPLLRPQCAGVG